MRDIHMRWGAILGSLISIEDAEKIFYEISGVEYKQRDSKDNFKSTWKEFEYRPIRKDPIEWFMKNILGV